MSTGQLLENTGDMGRYPRTHKHVVNTGQHGAKERGHRRYLDFREQVVPHDALVTLFCQGHLDKRRENEQVNGSLYVPMSQHLYGAIGLRRNSTRGGKLVNDLIHNRGQWKAIQNGSQ